MNIDNSVKDNREKEKCNKDDSNKEANSMFVWFEKKKLTEADLGLVKIYSFHKQQSPTQEGLCYERVFWTIF